MNSKTILTILLSVIVTILLVAVVVYGQVLWQLYQSQSQIEEVEIDGVETDFYTEERRQITPEDKELILDTLYIPTEEEFSLDERVELLNSLSTSSNSDDLEGVVE